MDALERIISHNVYNYKDQLITMYQGETGNGKTGNLEYAQKIDYTYRVDGLLERINDDNLTGSKQGLGTCTDPTPADPSTSNYDNKDLFYTRLYYDDSSNGQQNGNIAKTEWKVRGRWGQMYTYDYDVHDRLKEAKYYGETARGYIGFGTFDTNYTYDERGNIETLVREGKAPSGGCYNNITIDDMDYYYHSSTNQLQRVLDAGSSEGFTKTYGGTTAYTYDSNGNLDKDENKGITSITYNHLDLPTLITTGSQSIVFIYDATGTLLNKKHKNGSTVVEERDYIGGIEYVDGSKDAVYHIKPA